MPRCDIPNRYCQPYGADGRQKAFTISITPFSIRWATCNVAWVGEIGRYAITKGVAQSATSLQKTKLRMGL